MVLSHRSFLIKLFKRKFASTAKVAVIPDEKTIDNISNTVYTPKTHPGILKPRAFKLPDKFIEAAVNIIGDHPIKLLREDGIVLVNHLRDKRPPLEMDQLKKAKRDAYERVLAELKLPDNYNKEDLQIKQNIANKVNIILRRELYHWKPVSYDVYNSLVYLVSRAPAEYSVLAKTFLEIAKRDPNFKPRALFDFGSGVGVATWAANLYWKHCLFEYFNVDTSGDMNDLAQLLLQQGKGTNQMDLRGVYYRQFLPVSNVGYDLVICAYSLLELPSQQSRLDTLLTLWNKTQTYLVIIEQGTNAGFQIINEARDFLLHTIRESKSRGFVFSPCPHDQICPRLLAADGTPCNFEAFYFDFSTGKENERKQERYSYVVFKKGRRKLEEVPWPRVVRETLVRSKHTICRMCSADATLQEVIFTSAKHGKNLYHCARATKWGDLLPINIQQPVKDDDLNEEK